MTSGILTEWRERADAIVGAGYGYDPLGSADQMAIAAGDFRPLLAPIGDESNAVEAIDRGFWISVTSIGDQQPGGAYVSASYIPQRAQVAVSIAYLVGNVADGMIHTVGSEVAATVKYRPGERAAADAWRIRRAFQSIGSPLPWDGVDPEVGSVLWVGQELAEASFAGVAGVVSTITFSAIINPTAALSYR